jgi:manganese/zinc/iron transport system permease protein
MAGTTAGGWWSLEYNTLVVMAGVTLLGVTSGVVGTFMVLRRRALAGDALAHAALPGLVTSFLIFQRRELGYLLAGALASALLGIAVIAGLRRYTRIKEDAAIGIVLSVFFGLGVVLSRWVQNRSTSASRAGLDSFILGKATQMTLDDVAVIGGLGLATLLVVGLLYKEIRLVTFDQGFARAQGWPTVALDLTVLTLLAVNVMMGLPAVGVVLMAALLVIPPVTARLWTDRFDRLIWLSPILGAGAGLLGTLWSAEVSEMPTGPAIILTGAGALLASMVLAPRRGLVSRWASSRAFGRAVDQRALLQEVYEYAESNSGRWPTRTSLVHRVREARALVDLERQGLIATLGGDAVALSEAGGRRALAIVRGSRLWQAFLEEYPEQASGLVDLAQESVEGLLPDETIRELRDAIVRQGRWPSPLSVAALTKGNADA